MYQAIVFNVFIASPTDVREEREIVKERIARWNTMHSEEKKIVLLPLAYETHTPSEVGRAPQKVIDEHVLDKADYLIAIFWSRVGSGATIEEIEKHVDTGKPAALLFCTRPVEQDVVDQINHVKKLKEQYKDRSFYHEFRELGDFNDLVDQNLNSFVSGILKKLPDAYEGIVGGDHSYPSELSDRAKDIIKHLYKTKRPFRVHDFGGQYQVDSGLHTFYSGRDGREYRLWKDCVEELSDFLEYKLSTSHGEVYELTSLGWGYGEELNEDEE